MGGFERRDIIFLSKCYTDRRNDDHDDDKGDDGVRELNGVLAESTITSFDVWREIIMFL